jgi:membrane-associated phospholipid phosphatase
MATCTLIPFLELIPMKQKKQKIIMQVTIIGFSGFFILIVMICRITSGNHYLSDVTAAVLINMACFISSYFICN